MFPDAPVVGDRHDGWIWDGCEWRCTCPGGSASHIPPKPCLATVSRHQPQFPQPGQLWWSGRTLRVFDGIHWHDVVGDPGLMYGMLANYFLPLLGGTLHGPLLLFQDAVADCEPVTLRQLKAVVAEIEGMTEEEIFNLIHVTVPGIIDTQVPPMIDAAIAAQVPTMITNAINLQVPPLVNTGIANQVPGLINTAINAQVPPLINAAVANYLPLTGGTVTGTMTLGGDVEVTAGPVNITGVVNITGELWVNGVQIT